MTDLPTIASLWIGGSLSWLEQLCLKSFADAGHPTILYSYEPIPNIPEGVAAGNAADIFPAEPMLRHARTGSPAIHADLWRLHLLAKTDAIWVDADMYCHKPFSFGSPFVFGWEKPDLVCNAVLGLPRDSKTLAALLDFLSDPYVIAPWLKPAQRAELEQEAAAGTPVHLTEQNWGFTGPAAVTHFLKETGEIAHAQGVDVFYPISFKDRNHMIRRSFNIPDRLSDNTKGVHFWARRMKPRLQEKENNVPMQGSYLRQLIEKHAIVPADAPIPAKVKRAPENSDALKRKILTDINEQGHSIDKVCRTYLVEKAFVKDCLKNPVSQTPMLGRDILKNYTHERHFLQNVHVSRAGTCDRNFVYVKNHKAACTTILATLLECQRSYSGANIAAIPEQMVHKPPARFMMNGRRNLDFETAISALSDTGRFKFTVIREPVSRTVSAFADKILGDEKQKSKLMKAIGKPADTEIGLSEFIDVLAHEPAVMDLDRHWRLQSKEISYGLVDYDLIGTVENVSDAMLVAVQTCFGLDRLPLQDTRKTFGHKTSSRSLVENLTPTDRRNLDKVLEPDLAMYEAVTRASK